MLLIALAGICGGLETFLWPKSRLATKATSYNPSGLMAQGGHPFASATQAPSAEKVKPHGGM